jgi:hypothetical protein
MKKKILKQIADEFNLEKNSESVRKILAWREINIILDKLENKEDNRSKEVIERELEIKEYILAFNYLNKSSSKEVYT